MARDDWRVRIELTEAGPAATLLERLGLDLGSEARELAKELSEHRLAVTRDEDSVFVYAPSRRAAEQARAVVEAELRDLRLEARATALEHWLAEQDRWDDDPPQADVEDEVLARGYAPWEVRVDCRTADAARALAEQLEAEGYGVVRRWRYVLAGTETREQADALAARVQGEVEPGGELVWEVTPANPFALLLGGIGG
ncbi:MAG TPA: hypothetical protein VFL66_04550 [Gaiellaceae bacterium]|nr:hypothetical protein [Gaiellaceae bacterium]